MNYIIASFEGRSKAREAVDPLSENVLNLQIETLLKIFQSKQKKGLVNFVKQVSIIVPKVSPGMESYPNYYRFEEWSKQFGSYVGSRRGAFNEKFHAQISNGLLNFKSAKRLDRVWLSESI